MTLGIGLGTWNKNGSLNRELAIYEYFISKGWDVTIFTYDKAANIPPLNSRKIDTKTKIPPFLPARLYWLYALLMPFLFYKEGKKLDIIKTNQAHSGWPAVLCGKVWRKKVIARCGYVFGEQAENQRLKGFYTYRKRFLEKLTFIYADICFIPTPHLRKWVLENYNVDPLKIKVMPNTVDVDLFKPSIKQKSEDILNIIAVGRLTQVKRIDLLIDSIENKNWKLTLIGEGHLKDFLEKKAREKGISVEFIGNCANHEIPIFLNKASVFVICSFMEGNPKALIEAMACGCACIGTNSPGIREIITHNENGILCLGNALSIKNAINTILSDKRLKLKIQNNARKTAVENYSFNKILDKEIKVLNTLTSDKCK